MKIPRLSEVTMVWQFGGYNDEFYRPNPDPFEFKEETPFYPHRVALTRVKAVLYGQEGKLEFEFKVPTIRHGDIGYDEVRCFVHGKYRLLADKLVLPGKRYEMDSQQENFRRYTFAFHPQPGEPFTGTAVSGFNQGLAILFPSENKTRLPVPSVLSKSYWQLGEERVPFGMGLVLDQCMDGGFQKVRQTYATEGPAAAYRVYYHLWRKFRNEERRDKVMSDYSGVEILLGKRDRYNNGERMSGYQYCLTMTVDGYDIHSPKFGSASIRARESLRSQAKECAATMKKFGLKWYKLIQGVRTRHTTNERVPCSVLDTNELFIFQRALEEERCYQAV